MAQALGAQASDTLAPLSPRIVMDARMRALHERMRTDERKANDDAWRRDRLAAILAFLCEANAE